MINQTWKKREDGVMELVEEITLPDPPPTRDIVKDVDTLRNDLDNIIKQLKAKNVIS